jgi:dTDP-4-dehydrorhamnose reductase
MAIHDKDIKKSIDLNIIGTANITKACEKKNIKLIYFSTHYVYSGVKGDYKETDPVLPVNNYAWSKLGGEASVHLYKNSLILRLCMTEKPFVHKKAFTNVKTNFMFHEDVIPIVFKLIDCKGIINIGGKKQSIYNFALQSNRKIKKDLAKKDQIPINSTLNLKKMKLALKS